jgi:predicted transcriptional regulator
MNEYPKNSQAEWAAAIGITRQNVWKKLKILRGQRLVEESATGWRITKKGKAEIERD